MSKINMNRDFLDLAYKFWKLTENAIEIMENTGNKDIVFTDGGVPHYASWSDAEEIFKWNANSIGIPVLFNFYHGVELFMKGFMLNEKILNDKSHKLSDMYNFLRSTNSAPKKVLIILKEIIYPKHNVLKVFFNQNDNKNNVDNFYILLKYPVINIENNVDYSLVRKSGMDSFENLFNLIRSYINKLYNALIEHNCIDNEIANLIKK